MAGMSSLTTAGAVTAADTAGVSTMVDVGGSDGQFVLELMAADPRLHGEVLDLPHAAERAREEAGQRGLSGRFSAVAGDFFTEVPAADLYLLKTILHDWDDDRATAILRNCRAAANEGGRALVVETVIGEIGKPDSAFATIADMVMLLHNRRHGTRPGRVRRPLRRLGMAPRQDLPRRRGLLRHGT
jgi:hypothetical protein